jgi:RNA polymerase sigma-70 factor (ECF subfamily)
MSSPALSGSDHAVLPNSFRASQFRHDLIALIPQLRAFSRVLCGTPALADDLAREALKKAWQTRGGFGQGANLKAWAFAILRNEFYSRARRSPREAHGDGDDDGYDASARPGQARAVVISDTVRAFGGLPAGQREALILVSAGGFSYEDAAKICGRPIGTMKSRAARARIGVMKFLDGAAPQATNAPDETASHQSIPALAVTA